MKNYSSRIVALSFLSLAAALAPFAAHAADAPAAKVIKGSCTFPSDKLISSTVAELVKKDLTARTIAFTKVRVKLAKLKPAPAPETIDQTALSFSVNASGGTAAPLDYSVLGAANVNQAISFDCNIERSLDITVSAKIDGAKKSSTSHLKVFVKGALK